MKIDKVFRLWWYTRQGYQNYLAFFLVGINTLTVTYFLAIERAPFLESVFPTFLSYVIILMGIGLPMLAVIGYIHFKKVPGYGAQASSTVENNPYVYKLPPGWNKNVNMPYFLLQSKILMKIAQNEKVSEEEKNELKTLQKKMDVLIKGGYVGVKKGQRAFEDIDEER